MKHLSKRSPNEQICSLCDKLVVLGHNCFGNQHVKKLSLILFSYKNSKKSGKEESWTPTIVWIEILHLLRLYFSHCIRKKRSIVKSLLQKWGTNFFWLYLQWFGFLWAHINPCLVDKDCAQTLSLSLFFLYVFFSLSVCGLNIMKKSEKWIRKGEKSQMCQWITYVVFGWCIW